MGKQMIVIAAMASILILSLLLFFIVASSGKGGKATIDYPEGYRGWLEVKSMVIQEGHGLHNPLGGPHYTYGNQPAPKAIKEAMPPQSQKGSDYVFSQYRK